MALLTFLREPGEQVIDQREPRSVALLREILRTNSADLEREEAGVQWTDKERVCLVAWERFRSGAMDNTAREFARENFKKAGLHGTDVEGPNASFYIAQRCVLVDSTDTLDYVEGFRFLHGVPEYRAWNAIGAVIVDHSTPNPSDKTLSKRDFRYSVGMFRAGYEFIGRRIDTQLVMDLYNERRGCFPVLAQYDSCYGEPVAGTYKELAI